LSDDAVEDPIGVQSKLREQCPVAWTERGGGFWSIFRYEDIARVARDPEGFAQGRPQRGNARPPLEVNPPLHTEYRTLLRPYFGSSAIADKEPMVRDLVVAGLEPLIAAGGGDFARTFTYPLPTQVICGLLRLPESASALVNDLSDQIYLNEDGRGGNAAAVAAAESSLTGLAASVVAERRRSPQDPEIDLISGLVAGSIQGKPLSDDQIVDVLRLLFVAGHNSTTSSLGICFLAIAQNPDRQHRLRAVDEFLRLETPVMGMPRTVMQPTEIHRRTMEPGDQLFLVWAAGNRDGRQFRDADQCQIERHPNTHLTFGRGIHACIGRGLAELELRVACEELLRRSKNVELTGPVRRSSWVRYGVSELHLQVAKN
jgi:cytochrome P450